MLRKGLHVVPNGPRSLVLDLLISIKDTQASRYLHRDFMSVVLHTYLDIRYRLRWPDLLTPPGRAQILVVCSIPRYGVVYL